MPRGQRICKAAARIGKRGKRSDGWHHGNRPDWSAHDLVTEQAGKTLPQ